MSEKDDQIVEEEILEISEDSLEETLESEEEVIEETETSEENPENEEEEEPLEEDQEDEDDRIVTIGEETSEEESSETPAWVKATRKSNRKLTSENKKLKRQLEELMAEKKPVIELGQKPTLASCDYDDEKYEKELDDYLERKRKVEEQEIKQAETVKKQNEAWKIRQDTYVSKKQEHAFKDFDEAEDLVDSTFSQTQRGIIIQGAEDAALLVYALGKNPKKLEALASIEDPIAFAFEVAKLETKLSIKNRKTPSPEKRVVTGNSGMSSNAFEKKLDALRAKAEKTGDYSSVIAFKKKYKDKLNG